MEEKIKQQLVEHLNKICKDKQLKQFALDFFEDLCSHYEGQVFSKDNFETLNIDGEEIEQDIVKELFADREGVPAEEILLYLFEHHVKKIKYYTPIIDDLQHPNSNGFYDCVSKVLAVKMPALSYTKIRRSASAVGVKTTRKQKKEEKQRIKQQNAENKEFCLKRRREKVRHNFYHEMGHMFELKSFKNGRCLKNRLSDSIITVGKTGKWQLSKSELSDEEIKKKSKQKSKNVQAIPISERVQNVKLDGFNAISEILNEMFASRVDGSLKFTTKFSMSSDTKIGSKKEMNGYCSYNRNFDIARLLELACSGLCEQDFRFNSNAVIDQLNNLNVSLDFVISVMNEMANELSSYMDEASFNELMKELQDKDISTIIGVMMGFADAFDNVNLKSCIQTLLIESIKNDISAKLADDSIVKDEEFFAKINSMLQIIDGCINYPIEMISFGEEQYNLRKSTEILSVEQFVQRYPQNANLASFNSLINEIKQALKQAHLANEQEIMTFLQEQAELEKECSELEQEVKKKMERTSGHELVHEKTENSSVELF